MLLLVLLLALACMVLPYGVKNPPRRFPYATITLMCLNIVAHFLACDLTSPLYVIRPDVVDSYALLWGSSPVYTVFTSMFLHADIVHLGGNMLYLWVFGPAVEDRLGVPMYIVAYLLAGAAGDVVQVTLDASWLHCVSVPVIGASGAIFGLLGAYWYAYPWSPVCVFYSFLWVIRGVVEKKAFWVIGAYFLMNLAIAVRGRIDGATSGVANFAHVGGCLVGVVLVWALRVRRDSPAISEAKANHSEVRDINLLPCVDVCRLVEANPDDEELFVEYARKTCRDGCKDDVEQAISMNHTLLMVKCPDVALYYVTNLSGDHTRFSAGDLLHLAKAAEAVGNLGAALGAYRLIQQHHPDSPQMEMALYMSAMLSWHSQQDATQAIQKLDELLSRFANGALKLDAEDLRQLITRENGDEQRPLAA